MERKSVFQRELLPPTEYWEIRKDGGVFHQSHDKEACLSTMKFYLERHPDLTLYHGITSFTELNADGSPKE